jgi:hypothetical protein
VLSAAQMLCNNSTRLKTEVSKIPDQRSRGVSSRNGVNGSEKERAKSATRFLFAAGNVT